MAQRRTGQTTGQPSSLPPQNNPSSLVPYSVEFQLGWPAQQGLPRTLPAITLKVQCRWTLSIPGKSECLVTILLGIWTVPTHLSLPAYHSIRITGFGARHTWVQILAYSTSSYDSCKGYLTFLNLSFFIYKLYPSLSWICNEIHIIIKLNYSTVLAML